jgi:hypothetical protein
VVIVQGFERRTDGYWVHTGKLVVRSALELQPPEQPPGGTASLVLPDGIITTPMIAQNAVQEQIGSFAQLVSFTLTQTNVWTETPVQVTATVDVVRTRIEFNVLIGSPTKGQRVLWGIMVDGSAPGQGALGGVDTPENNYGSMAVGTYYFTPSTAASHRFAFGLYGPAGAQIFNAFASTLYVTQQKR